MCPTTHPSLMLVSSVPGEHRYRGYMQYLLCEIQCCFHAVSEKKCVDKLIDSSISYTDFQTFGGRASHRGTAGNGSSSNTFTQVRLKDTFVCTRMTGDPLVFSALPDFHLVHVNEVRVNIPPRQQDARAVRLFPTGRRQSPQLLRCKLAQ